MPSAPSVLPSCPAIRKSPRLLVSVRSALEARNALSGGCDILDVKEPSRGPLGMADLQVIREVADAATTEWPEVRLSIALGEARDWSAPSEFPRFPHRVDFVKAGVAGISLKLLRTRLNELQVASQAANIRPGKPLDWVLAAYADAESADAPDLESLFHLSAELGFRGVLIDTWNKSGPRLSSQLSETHLQELKELARNLDLQFAIAGRLQRLDLPFICRISPDIVGIRSAACSAGDRNTLIVADRVREFGTALRGMNETMPEPIGRPDRLTTSNGGVK